MNQYERFLLVITLLSTGHLTIYEMAKAIRADERTAYRHINLLQDMGFTVNKTKGIDVRYNISEWPKELVKARPGA